MDPGGLDQLEKRLAVDQLCGVACDDPLRLRLEVERGDDAAIPDELAMTYFRIGRITEQIDSPDEALPSFERALEMQKRLVAEHAADGEHLEALGNTYSAVGGVLFKQHKLDEAQQAHQEDGFRP